MLIFWRGIFFFFPTPSCHEEEVELWVWLLSLVAALQTGIEMAMAAVWVWGVFFKFGPWEWSCWAVRNICTGREQRGWDQLLPVCSSLPLRQKEFCFWSALTHFCLIPLFAYFFPSSHGYLSTGTENFTSWSPGMLLGIIIKKQNKISGC